MKKLVLFLTLLSSAHLSRPCAWFPEGDRVRFSLFASDLGGSTDMSVLYYSPHVFNWYKVDDYKGPTENLKEWEAYFDGKFSRSTIDQMIYGDLDSDEMKENKLMKHFRSGEDEDVLEYLIFSKILEEQLRKDPWQKKKIDYQGLQESIAFIEKKRGEVKNELLQLRYAFQLLVINYYLGEQSRVETIYKKDILTYPKETVIKQWAHFYYANMMDYYERMYNLALVFDQSRSKNQYIYQKYPTGEKQKQEILNYCKNDHERSAVLTIIAFKNPGRAKDQIIEIANLDPNQELLDILMIREVNKMEDWYLSRKYIGYGPSISTFDEEIFGFIDEKNFASDKKYLQSFREEMENLLKDGKVDNQSLWLTSLAYMSYMLDDESATGKYLKMAEKEASSMEMKGQIAIIEVLHLVKYQKEWDEKFQSKLSASIQKVEELQEHIYNYDRFYNEIMLAISRQYLEKGELILAALWESKVNGEHVYEQYSRWSDEERGYQSFDMLNEYATSEDMDALFDFWNKSNKTPTEQWLFKDLEPYKWRLTDLWGTAYFREDKLEKALEIYETIPDSIWVVDNWRLHYFYGQELDNDPFETNLIGRSYGPNQSGNTYTKPEFIKEILKLQKMLDGPTKDKAYHAILLGNAYYNMSYGGNSYYYTEYSWSSYESDSYPRDQAYYYNAERALNYYKMAEEFAPNEAYAAFAHRLQLKCKRDAYRYSLEKRNEVKQKQVDDWKLFAQKYPDHYKKLTNCDHFTFYSSAWKRG